MLILADVSRRYGDVAALEGVSLEVRPGEIVGLLGANGAGKSTLLRTAAGLQAPDAGTIHVDGVDLWAHATEAKARLGYAAEEPEFYEDLSADEYLAFIAGIRLLDPEPARRRAVELYRRFGLAGREGEPVRGLSHGTRKKISFTAAVLHCPRVLLCDEALEGFDAAAALAAKQELRALAAAGTAVLFSSHVTETIERLCDRVVMLHRGRVAETLTRAEWGAPEPGLSPLERRFLALMRDNAPEAVGS